MRCFDLGERESGTARLKRRSLPIARPCRNTTRERVPLDWATTQNNLGNALWTPRRARERHGAPRRGGRGLSRGLAGIHARARAARLGHDPEQPRHCAAEPRRARERHGAPRRGGRGLSRGLAGIHARARAARVGHDPEQSRHCALAPRRARERHGAPRRGGRRLSRGPEGMHPRARAARLGHDPEQPRQCA